MADKYFMTLEKSQDDTPVLVIYKDNEYYGLFGNASHMNIVSTITGRRALEIFAELTNRAVDGGKKNAET